MPSISIFVPTRAGHTVTARVNGHYVGDYASVADMVSELPELIRDQADAKLDAAFYELRMARLSGSATDAGIALAKRYITQAQNLIKVSEYFDPPLFDETYIDISDQDQEYAERLSEYLD